MQLHQLHGKGLVPADACVRVIDLMPYLAAISKSLSKRSVAARINGQLWDLARPLVDGLYISTPWLVI